MLRLPDAWVWDFWLADTGQEFHLFFLRASRAVHDPDRRHRHASIGHAVSADLRSWELLADALVPGDEPAFDDLATWTGSVVQAPDGVWHMFYTGVSHADNGLVQRIGLATSTDLLSWNKEPDFPIVTADQRWYETGAGVTWREEAWRDPWVFPDPEGHGWHMLITARAAGGTPDDRGVVGHAASSNLWQWQVGPPLSRPGAGFGHLEVLQIERVDGRALLLFSCSRTDLSAARAATGISGGIFAVPCDTVLGPVDIGRARRIADDGLYSGRLVRDRAGRWVMLAVQNTDHNGCFPGVITDPIPAKDLGLCSDDSLAQGPADPDGR